MASLTTQHLFLAACRSVVYNLLLLFFLLAGWFSLFFFFFLNPEWWGGGLSPLHTVFVLLKVTVHCFPSRSSVQYLHAASSLPLAVRCPPPRLSTCLSSSGRQLKVSYLVHRDTGESGLSLFHHFQKLFFNIEEGFIAEPTSLFIIDLFRFSVFVT